MMHTRSACAHCFTEIVGQEKHQHVIRSSTDRESGCDGVSTHRRSCSPVREDFAPECSGYHHRVTPIPFSSGLERQPAATDVHDCMGLRTDWVWSSKESCEGQSHGIDVYWARVHAMFVGKTEARRLEIGEWRNTVRPTMPDS